MQRSTNAAAEVARISTYYPLLPTLGLRWARNRPWDGLTVALNAHLTTLTAALVRELTLGGGNWVVCAANQATTDPAVVDLLRSEGVEVESGRELHNRHVATLDRKPQIIADVGFELLSTLLERRPALGDGVQGAVEITRTGINRMRTTRLPFGVVNINDSQLKHNVENRHGVGEGLWPCVTEITGMHLAGRKVAVVGYGPVGQGIAHYGRALGASVEVIERDPIRRLVALYDGFPSPEMVPGLERADIVVSATGRTQAISLELLGQINSNTVLVNAGHGRDEIDVEGLGGAAVQGDQLGRHCVRYRLRGDGPWLSVLGDGNPLNIVLNAGSPEPVLLQFALLGLTLEWVAGRQLPPGECAVPAALEAETARLALAARA